MKEDHTAPQSILLGTLGNDSWTMLQIFSLYRCLLTSAFFILNAMHTGNIGQEQPLLYIYSLLIYFMLSIVYVVNTFSKRQSYYSQVALQLITDILALTVILYTSGGITSGLNILFLPVIAAAGVLAPGQVSFSYAALATIAILTEQTYSYMQGDLANKRNFTLAGLTGIAFFATAIAVNIIYKRLTASQKLGQEYKESLEKFEQVIAMVLDKMPTGVVLVDQNYNISMINLAAEKLLGGNDLPEKLISHIDARQEHRTEFNYNDTNVQAQFIPFGPDDNRNVIIMLDDLSQQEQQAQNMKLISLGRLTASIAHEIRNPLNAISHSAQLLSENVNFQPEEARLLDIIQNNTVRTNKIIESVLLLSKSKPIAQQHIHLFSWLEKFVSQFQNINLVCESKDLTILFDPTHLQQILTNLCENGLRYSKNITLKANTHKQQVYIDIIDHGAGIEEKNLKYLFEPFFTTENSGTGLGLFVAKELSRANGAKLDYYNTPATGSYFRITFNGKL